MQSKSIRALILLTSAVICLAAFLVWKRGTPFQQPYWSPNGRYYVQKYSNFSIGGLLPGAGQGSDSISGYIRVYSRDGKLLHERYQTFLRDIDPVWAGNKLYLRGVAEMDNNPWLLPQSSEVLSNQ